MAAEYLPLIGAGIQAASGIIGGAISGDAQRDAYRAQANAIRNELEQLGYDSETINQYLGGLTPKQLGQEVNARYETLGQIAGNAGPEFGDFDTSSFGVQNYLNPYLDFMQQQTVKGFQQAAASRGIPRGGAYDTALANRINQLSGSEYWDKAFNRAASERESAYGKFLDKFNADRQYNANQYSRAMDMYNAAQGRAGAGRSAFENQANVGRQMRMDLENARALRDNAMQMAIGQGIGNLGSSIGQGVGSMSPYMASQQTQPIQQSGNGFQYIGTSSNPASMTNAGIDWSQYRPYRNSGENLVPSGNIDMNFKPSGNINWG